MQITEQQLAAAFTEWERRMREEQARFEANQAFRECPVEERGQRCARYLLEIIALQTGAEQP
jgi:hypothetical protein